MVDEHIKMLQEVYQGTYQRPNKTQNKGKGKEVIIQDDKVLYKPYVILSSSKPSRLLTPEPILSQEEVKNLEKALKILQSPTKSTPFIHMT